MDGSEGIHCLVCQFFVITSYSIHYTKLYDAVNLAGARATGDYVLYFNDDMVLAPGWDAALERAIARVARYGAFMLSGTMIEPAPSGNACVAVADFGREPASFDLERFARRITSYNVCYTKLLRKTGKPNNGCLRSRPRVM